MLRYPAVWYTVMFGGVCTVLCYIGRELKEQQGVDQNVQVRSSGSDIGEPDLHGDMMITARAVDRECECEYGAVPCQSEEADTLKHANTRRNFSIPCHFTSPFNRLILSLKSLSLGTEGLHMKSWSYIRGLPWYITSLWRPVYVSGCLVFHPLPNS